MTVKKKRLNTPRHKRLKRESRLQAASHWISKYEGESIVKAYSRHFAVNKLCAIKELQMLGHKIDTEYIEALVATVECERRTKEFKREVELEKKALEVYLESDDIFYYIAGYTEGGAPYGITWNEYENVIKQDFSLADERRFKFENEENPF